MMTDGPDRRLERRPSTGRLLLFASGDFACNLYWQSSILYLLFFYTEVLRLEPAIAGLIAMVGALWDGIADLGIGILAQRSRIRLRHWVAGGTVPLGVSFVSLYIVPAGGPGRVAMLALAAQMLFRSFYALVNVTYSAWSVRISPHSDDRATIAGARMLFGTAAAFIVAMVTQHFAQAADGSPTRGGGFVASAALFAVVGTVLLLLVAGGTTEPLALGERPEPASIGQCFRALAGNKVFVTLNAAAAATTIAGTLLMRSVLYFFSHVVGDSVAGSRTLAAMGVVGAVAVPLWMLVARRYGKRAVWLIAATAAPVICVLFAAQGAEGSLAAAAFLLAMQAVLTGFGFAFWAMLPDAVDYGEMQTGLRVDAVTFGVAALLQKLALGIAAGLIGLVYELIGYRVGGQANALAQTGIAGTMVLGPALFIALSLPFMIASPLRRDTHAAVLAALESRRRG